MLDTMVLLFIVILLTNFVIQIKAEVEIEILTLPDRCKRKTVPTDHVQFTMSIIKSTTGEEVFEGNNYEAFHLELGAEKVMKGLSFGLNDMCEGESRMLRIPPEYGYDVDDIDQQPVIRPDMPVDDWIESTLDITVKLLNITPADDFQIFQYLKSGNLSKTMSDVDEHIGINAIDEYGATPLMLSIMYDYDVLTAMLLNTYQPKVVVDASKPSGRTALHYASSKTAQHVVKALLGRGANPNAQIIDINGNYRWTPLHFAARFNKPKNYALLIQHGADPTLRTGDGSTVHDLAMDHETPFRRMIERSITEWNQQQANALPGGPEL